MVKQGSDFNFDIELYEFRMSRSDRALRAVYELGLEEHMMLEHVSSKFAAPDPTDPKYHNLTEMKKHNAMVQVPTMVLTAADGRQITNNESCAMTHLAPSVDNVFGRSQYYRMMSFAASELDNAVTALFFNVRFYNGKEMDKENAARKTFDDKVAKLLERILDNDGCPVQWICEPYYQGFTAADIVVGWALWIVDAVDMHEGHPVLKDYL